VLRRLVRRDPSNHPHRLGQPLVPAAHISTLTARLCVVCPGPHWHQVQGGVVVAPVVCLSTLAPSPTPLTQGCTVLCCARPCSHLLPPAPCRILGKVGGVPALGGGMKLPVLPRDQVLRATGGTAAREIHYSKMEGKDAP